MRVGEPMQSTRRSASHKHHYKSRAVRSALKWNAIAILAALSGVNNGEKEQKWVWFRKNKDK